MRNAGIIGSVLIGVGYFMNKGKFMGSDHFASNEEAYMAEKKARFRHTFDGDGQAEFEGSYLKFSKALPYAWIIENGVAPLSKMITNVGAGGTNRNRIPKKERYNEAVSKSIDALENAPENGEQQAWRNFMYMITGDYRGHNYLPTSLPKKEQLFRLLIESREWVENHPQVRTLTDDSKNDFTTNQGYGRRSGNVKLRMYGKEPKIMAQADYRLAVPSTHINDVMTEEDFRDHAEKAGIIIDHLSYYGTYGYKGWLQDSPLPDAKSRGFGGLGQTKRMPEYYQNRYMSMVIIPPVSWWPTDADIDGWYSRIEDIFGGDKSPANVEMRQRWNYFKGFIAQGTPEQPIPIQRQGMRHQYHWGRGVQVLASMKQFKGMPDYDAVANQVKDNLRANIALTKDYLKDL